MCFGHGKALLIRTVEMAGSQSVGLIALLDSDGILYLTNVTVEGARERQELHGARQELICTDPGLVAALCTELDRRAHSYRVSGLVS